MNTIFEYLIHTPWYVYLILVYIIIIGKKALKGGSVPVVKLAIIPVIFVWMSVDEMMNAFHLTGMHIFIWLVSAAIGAYVLGWMLYQRLDIKAIKAEKSLYIPGNKSTMILLLITFIVKYAIAVTLMSQDLTNTTIYLCIIISGFLTGAFVGRLLYAMYLLKNGPFITEAPDSNSK